MILHTYSITNDTTNDLGLISVPQALSACILKKHYEISEDWKGTKFIGLTLKWDYSGRKAHISMPGYAEDVVRFRHEQPKRKQNAPHKHTPPNYGGKTQYAKP